MLDEPGVPRRASDDARSGTTASLRTGLSERSDPITGYLEYSPSAEYLHLLSAPMWTELAGRLGAALSGADPGSGTRWTMTYRTLDGDTEITRAVAEYDWWTVSAATLAAELSQAGAATVRIDGDLVIARAAFAETAS